MSLPNWISASHTWDLVAPGYAAEITPIFRRFAEEALELAHLAQGERVLDVATGPGTLALAAARAGARVSAIDFSPRMIAELEQRARDEGVASIDARVADARALPYEDATFDAVFSMFALNLIEDPSAAFREIRRVLRPGGRAVVGTPASRMHRPALAAIQDILRRTLPSVDVDLEIPLAEPGDLERELRIAGFDDVSARTSTRTVRFASIGAIWAMASRAVAPVVVARESMDAERWARGSEEVVRALEQRFGAGPHEIAIVVNLASARA